METTLKDTRSDIVGNAYPNLNSELTEFNY